MKYAILENGSLLCDENSKVRTFASKTETKDVISSLSSIQEGRVDSINLEISFIFNEIEFRETSISQMKIIDETRNKRSIARIKGIITILQKKIMNLNNKINKIQKTKYKAIQFV